MQVDIFEIISSELINPSNSSARVFEMIVYGLGMILVVCTDGFLHKYFKDKMSTNVGRLKSWLISVALILGLTFTLVTLFDLYSRATNPNAYTSYMTCIYQLKSDSEQVTHTTLIPREDGSKCSDIGKSVVRVKTEQSIHYYDTFEIPN